MAKLKTVAAFLIAGAGLLISSHMAQAAPCLDVVLTGTSGPPPYKGLAGPGTLVTYGDDANQCRSVILQFDVGRGTLMRMSQLDIEAAQVNAVFSRICIQTIWKDFQILFRCIGSLGALRGANWMSFARMMQRRNLASI